MAANIPEDIVRELKSIKEELSKQNKLVTELIASLSKSLEGIKKEISDL